MAVWSARPAGYKLGVLVLCLASLFYLIGYASPFWLVYGSQAYAGLWLTCISRYMRRYGSDTHCFTNKGSYSDDGWFKAVQAMESIGLIGMIISCVYAFVVNCCQRAPSHNRLLEILVASSGVSGFIGCMVFVGKTRDQEELYGWAFGLNLTGSLLLIVSAVIILLTNREVAAAVPSPSGTVTYTGGAPVQGYTYPPAGPQPQGYTYPPAGSQPQGYVYHPAGPQPQGCTYPPQGPQPGYVIRRPGEGPPQGYSGVMVYPGAQPQATALFLPPSAPPAQAGHAASAPPPSYSACVPGGQGYSGGQADVLPPK